MPGSSLGRVDVKSFWEHKILGWEHGRYADRPEHRGLLERIADRSSDSLRFRLKSAGELLAPYVAGKVVVDVGCGSGRLAGPLLAAGAARYVGIDIAESAIAAAHERAAEQGWGDKVSFRVGTVHALPDDVTPEVVVSLGLTDWLTDEELETLYAWSGDADYLHAISEQRAPVQRWIHATYCYVAYGWRTGGYVPRYFTVSQMAGLLAKHHPRPVRVWRDPRLSFGAYMTSLDLPGSEPA